MLEKKKKKKEKKKINKISREERRREGETEKGDVRIEIFFLINFF